MVGQFRSLITLTFFVNIGKCHPLANVGRVEVHEDGMDFGMLLPILRERLERPVVD